MRPSIAVLFVTVGLTLAGCTSLGTTSGGSGPTSFAPMSASVAPQTTSMAAQADWNALSTDNKNAGTAAGDGDQTGLATACGALKADVMRFEADPSTGVHLLPGNAPG